MGYDGRGQARIATREEALAAYAEFGGVPCVLEALMPLDYEISVVLARGFDGASVVFPVARNVHRDGILAVSTASAAGQDAAHAERQARATAAAQSIAQGLGYHGVLCVEFFVLKDGSLIVNEIAPRPHNSGHYTMDACLTSQFEQQARAIAGLPLGGADLLAPAVMLNILGDIWYESADTTTRRPDWAGALSTPTAKLHLYGSAKRAVAARWATSPSSRRRWRRRRPMPPASPRRWACRRRSRARPWLSLRPVQPRPRIARAAGCCWPASWRLSD